MEKSATTNTSTSGVGKVNPLDSLLLIAASIKKNIQQKDASLHSIHPARLAGLTKSCYQSMSEREKRAVDVLGKRLWICDPYRTEHTIEGGFYQKVLHAPEPSKSGSLTFSYSKFTKSKTETRRGEFDSVVNSKPVPRKRVREEAEDDESVSSDVSSASSSVSSVEPIESILSKRTRLESTQDEKIELSNFPKATFSRKTGAILESKSAREQLYADLFNQFTPVDAAMLPKWKRPSENN